MLVAASGPYKILCNSVLSTMEWVVVRQRLCCLVTLGGGSCILVGCSWLTAGGVGVIVRLSHGELRRGCIWGEVRNNVIRERFYYYYYCYYTVPQNRKFPNLSLVMLRGVTKTGVQEEEAGYI